MQSGGEAFCAEAGDRLAARGQWVTNEKQLVDMAGLRGIDDVLTGLTAAPACLTSALDAAGSMLLPG